MADAAADPASGLKHFYSPIGLFPFQAAQLEDWLQTRDKVVVWSPGLGKGPMAMATAAALVEDNAIEVALVFAEKDKLGEWVADFGVFTDLPTMRYHGPPAKRAALREQLGGTQVMVSTYATFMADLLTWRKGRKDPQGYGPLLARLLERQARVLIVLDEATNVRTTGSRAYLGLEMVTRLLSQRGRVLVQGLTATPVERGPEDFANIARLHNPALVGTVEDFERDYVVGRDKFGRVRYYKNVTPDYHPEPHVPLLRDRLAPLVLRKSKWDLDVREQFPAKVEQVEYVTVEGRLAEFYATIADSFADAGPIEQGQIFTVLRQVTGHPLALLGSRGEVSRAIVGAVGKRGLAALGSPKTERLVSRLSEAVADGSQALVFTFFGPTVGPLLVEAIRAAGMSAELSTGQGSAAEHDRVRAEFKAGGFQVLVSSDGGAKGVNLANATTVVHYELPLLTSLYTQRSDRVHRINSDKPSVTILSLIATRARLATVEDAVAQLCLNRERWSNWMIGPDGSVDAGTRRQMMALAKAEAVLPRRVLAPR